MPVRLLAFYLLIQGVWTFCKINELRCIDGTCVPASKFMNFVKDCKDGKYDEEISFWCQPSQMNCANGTCIPRLKFQNGINDCGDNSDEVQFPCEPPLYSCRGEPRVCIDMSQLDDGVVDCPIDASDEQRRLGGLCGKNEECNGDCMCGRFVYNSTCSNGTCVCDTGFKRAANKKTCIPRELNDICFNDGDCTRVIRYSTCTDGSCQCTTGYTAKGTKDCRPILLRDSCVRDEECLVFNNHSKCQDKVCACAVGYYEADASCKPRKLQELCYNNDECSTVIDNSICESGNCTCLTGFYGTEQLDSCIRRKVFDSCLVQEDCYVVIENTLCINGTCHCQENRKPAGNKTHCMQKEIGDVCNTDKTCSLIENSLCKDGQCRCTTGFYNRNTNTSCVRRKLFEPCDYDEDCSYAVNTSVCENNGCKCSLGMIETENNTACRRIVLDDPCTADIDCSYTINNSECTQNTCSCLIGFHASDDAISCALRKIGDQTCLLNVDCSAAVSHSKCDNGMCTCVSGYLDMNNGSKCIRRNISSPCTNNDDCSDAVYHSYCSKSSCVCLSGYKATNNDTTCELRVLDDVCNVDSDCFDAVSNSNCSSGLCKCNSGFKMFERSEEYFKHTTAIEMTMPTTSTIPTTMHTDKEMINHLEISPETKITPSGTVAYPDGSFGNLISSHTLNDENSTTSSPTYRDVFVADDSEAETTRAIPDNEMFNYFKTDQHASFPTTINETLTEYRSSTVGRTQSTSDMGFDVLDNTTFPTTVSQSTENISFTSSLETATPGQRNITEIENKSENSLATTSYIRRESELPDTISMHNNLATEIVTAQATDNPTQSLRIRRNPKANYITCVPRQLGDPCQVHTDCSDSVSNSFCKNNTCACTQGFNTGTDNITCNANKIWDDCIEDADCNLAVKDSLCLNGKCRCSGGFQVNAEKTICNKRKIFDTTCQVTTDCSLAVLNSICHQRQCICNTGYFATNGNQTCVKYKIGDKCQNVLDCQVAVFKSSCRNQICNCADGYMAEKDNTECKKRIIGDPCKVEEDCSSGVFRSVCTNNTCSCREGNDPIPELTSCVSSPTQLLDGCTFDAQCERLANQSVCGSLWGSRISTCVCIPGLHVRRDRIAIGECYAPETIGDFCGNRAFCQFGDNVQCEDNKCTCRAGYLANASMTGCISLPTAVGDFCRLESHCMKIPNSFCYENNTCQCGYKYQPSKDNKTCEPRPFTFVPTPPSPVLGEDCDARTRAPCHNDKEGKKYQICARAEGRIGNRCLCVPGYVTKFNADKFECKEIQTYYFDIVITHELGCENETEDYPVCYKYQPITVWEDYINETSGNSRYIDIRDRIVLSGFANLFMDTQARVRDRYMTSEVINITETWEGMQIGILVYLRADYYNVINETELEFEMIESLKRSHGEIGSSQLKMSWPFDDAIIYRDFDECTEQGGLFSDCSSIAWCLNTRVSYMCSCRHGYEDWSPDSDNRPGRVCELPQDITTDSLSCSDGKCENQWEYISLALVGFGFMLFFFIGYEIYARKKKLEKSDIYYKLQKNRIKENRERRRTLKKKKKIEEKEKKGKHNTEEEKQLIETVNET